MNNLPVGAGTPSKSYTPSPAPTCNTLRNFSPTSRQTERVFKGFPLFATLAQNAWVLDARKNLRRSVHSVRQAPTGRTVVVHSIYHPIRLVLPPHSHPKECFSDWIRASPSLLVRFWVQKKDNHALLLLSSLSLRSLFIAIYGGPESVRSAVLFTLLLFTTSFRH